MNWPFLSSTGPPYQNEGKCLAFDMEMIFHCRGNKSHFLKKGCALGLILKVRVSGTRKWPIKKTTSGILFHKSLKKNLAVKYITVLPLLNTKKKNFLFYGELSWSPNMQSFRQSQLLLYGHLCNADTWFCPFWCSF